MDKNNLRAGVDRASAVARLAGNEALYGELLRMFFDEAPALRLRGIFLEQGARAALFSAHNLKGAAANLGLNGLSAAAAEAEQAFRVSEPLRAEEALASLEQEHEALHAFFFDRP